SFIHSHTHSHKGGDELRSHAGRIVGGCEAVPHSRPYMVFLEKIMEGGEKKYCGGFLLSEDFMMTAAHCQAESYTAWVGVHDTSTRDSDKSVQKIFVEKAFPHQNYSDSSHVNDIMILKFSSKVKINHVVETISLADQDAGSLPSSCSVSGWGVTSWNNQYITNILKEVNVTVINDDVNNCSKMKFYCSKDKTGPGQGDSGGPLVCDGKAYGVVSTLSGQHSDGSRLARYTMIPDYIVWINSIIKNTLMHF
uniref:trypsin n=1 Tax=Nothobranchius furzeri TaxID=105023 RepID=A0A8C6PXT7_NOTFU